MALYQIIEFAIVLQTQRLIWGFGSVGARLMVLTKGGVCLSFNQSLISACAALSMLWNFVFENF